CRSASRGKAESKRNAKSSVHPSSLRLPQQKSESRDRAVDDCDATEALSGQAAGDLRAGEATGEGHDRHDHGRLPDDVAEEGEVAGREAIDDHRDEVAEGVCVLNVLVEEDAEEGEEDDAEAGAEV